MLKVDTTLCSGIVKMESSPIKHEVVTICNVSPFGSKNYAVGSGVPSHSEEGPVTFGSLAETFDLSLLGDNYEDRDTALVPSPGSWMQVSGGTLDPAYWQHMSLYDQGSPGASSDIYSAYSPDPKSIHSPPHIVTFDSDLSQEVPKGKLTSSIPVTPTVQNNSRNFLLRQCLEDTSFQRKCNFKPMDIPFNRVEMGGYATSENMLRQGNYGNSLELNQIEPVFSLAFEQVRVDIRKTCATLDISSNPLDWSSVDVQSWLAHTLSSLPRMTLTSVGTPMDVVMANFWNLDGRILHAFSEADFVRCDPDNGDRLFANLELWKISAQMDAVKGDLENILYSSAREGSLTYDDIMLPALRIPEENSSSGSSIGYSDGASDTCSSVDARSPRPSYLLPEHMHTDSDDEEDEDDDDKMSPLVGRGGVQKGPTLRTNGGAHIHLWQFLKELLSSPQQNGSCIRWLDQSHGVFKIEDSVRVARLWGLRKNRPAMNYDKLSRSIRQYYRKGIMRKTERSQRLVYQFCHPYGL